MEDDWDLHAVVRGCSATTSTATTTGSCDQLFTNFHQNFKFSDGGYRGLFETRRHDFIEELQHLYKPFFTNPQTSQPVFSPQSFPVSPISVVGGFKDLSAEQQQQQQQPSIKQPPQQTQVTGQNQQSLSLANVSRTKPSASTSQNPSPRSKRRKNHLKRVCHVPVENLSSDMWSWRKYGQKPIKGSPYPRGYYRCSTLKGCMARKQVERNRSDPGMFVVTYTAEHNHPMPTHRNSLAGSTRQKTATANSEDLNNSVLSPVMSPAETLLPAPEKLESSREDREEDLAEAEEEEDDFSVSNVILDDDFFAGLEDFVGPTFGDCLSDHFPTNIQFPWLANNATTTAAGGG